MTALSVLPIPEAKANLGFAIKDIHDALKHAKNNIARETLDLAHEEVLTLQSQMRQLDVAAEILKQGGVI